MKKLDLYLSLIAGLGIGFLFWWIVSNSAYNNGFLWIAPLVFPVLAYLAILIAYQIGKKYLFVYQLAKFALIGAVFSIFDLIIFNSLLKWFNINSEVNVNAYTSMVVISFVIATCAKFVADKYWAFEKKEGEQTTVEFGKFFAVTLVSGVIQAVVATFIVKGIPPLFGMNPDAWGNIGKMSGIVIASAWNFIGYKFIVFKK